MCFGLAVAGSCAVAPAAAALSTCDAPFAGWLTSVRLHGNETTADRTLLELLPRQPPAHFEPGDLAEFERRLNNLGIFDEVTVRCDSELLDVEVREKWTLVPEVDFATGETLGDSYASLGATEFNLLGAANQLGLSIYRERRGFGLSATFREHDYGRRGWAFGSAAFASTAAVAFEDGSGWRTGSVAAEVWFRSPPLLRDYANYTAGAYISSESSYAEKGITPQPSTRVVQSRMGFSWDNYEWHDLVPRGVQANLFLGVGGLFGGAAPRPRHTAELSVRAAARLARWTVLVARIVAAVGTRGDVNYGFLLGSIAGVRGLPDARYLDWIHAFTNVELRHSLPLTGRWALQLVVFADAAAFEPMTPSGGRDQTREAYSGGAGLRLVPTWISSLILRLDAARLEAPASAWFVQVGLTQYF